MEKQRSEGGGGGGGWEVRGAGGCNVGSFNIDIVFTAVLASIALSRKWAKPTENKLLNTHIHSTALTDLPFAAIQFDSL